MLYVTIMVRIHEHEEIKKGMNPATHKSITINCAACRPSRRGLAQTIEPNDAMLMLKTFQSSVIYALLPRLRAKKVYCQRCLSDTC